jgi:hypothetical protein
MKIGQSAFKTISGQIWDYRRDSALIFASVVVASVTANSKVQDIESELNKMSTAAAAINSQAAVNKF